DQGFHRGRKKHVDAAAADIRELLWDNLTRPEHGGFVGAGLLVAADFLQSIRYNIELQRINFRLVADGLRQEKQTVETPLLQFLRWPGVAPRNGPQVHNIVGKSIRSQKPLQQSVVVVRAVGTDRVG